MNHNDLWVTTQGMRCDSVRQHKSEPESAKRVDAPTPSLLTRRFVLSGLGAGFAQTLFRTQLKAARLPGGQTGEPGKLDFRLSALSPKILHISIAPVHEEPPKREPGILDSTHESPFELKEDSSLTLHWDRHTILIGREPLNLEVLDDAKR